MARSKKWAGEKQVFLGVGQSAARIGRDYHVVWRAIRAGELKASRQGKAYLIRVEDFQDWIDRTVRPFTPARSTSLTERPIRAAVGEPS